MNTNNELQTKKNDAPQQNILDLGRISAIAREALKDIISENKPAIPVYYEKAFYNTAMRMGEKELVTQLITSLPKGQTAMVMVEGVSSMITDLNTDIRKYQSGIKKHDGSLSDSHESIKQRVAPDVWEILENDFLGLHKANEEMKKQLVHAESRLKSQKNQVAKLQRKSRCDSLTGAMNRLAMEEDLPIELNRSKRYQRSYSVIMADIDHFKKINDTYGHDVGDEILKAFTRVLQESLREVDVVYRYGGEEFLILLPETSHEGALLAADRLRKAVESKIFKHRDTPSIKLQLTSSFGVSSNCSDDSSYNDIVKRADQALYKAKKAGRNRVESFD